MDEHEDEVEIKEEQRDFSWQRCMTDAQQADSHRRTQFAHQTAEAKVVAAAAEAKVAAEAAAEAEAAETARRAEETAAAKAAAVEAARVAAVKEEEATSRRMRERLAAIEARERVEAEARAARELEWERERQARRDAHFRYEERRRQEEQHEEARERAARKHAQAEADEKEARRCRQSAGERARAAEARAAERQFVTAVCRLQALVRGRRGRRRAAAARAAGASSSGSSQWALRQRAQEAAVVAAAVRLQAVVRGREGRRRVATLRERRREERAIALAMRGDEQQRRENLREVLSALPTSRDAAAAAADLCATQVSLPVSFAGSTCPNIPMEGAPAPVDSHGQPQPPSQEDRYKHDLEIRDLKLVLKIEQQHGSGGRASRRGVSHTARGAKPGPPRFHAQAPGSNAAFPSAGDSVSVFVPLSGVCTTAELLERCEAAITRVTGGGQRSSRCVSPTVRAHSAFHIQ